ncbi:MAG: hypothetical protein QM791_14715 [Ferruginibacter sp.]
MKKFIVSILALLYLGVSSGVAMEIHYCMGKQAGVELYGSDDDHCGKCGMKEKKGGCCSDEHKFYKLEDSHKNVSNDLQLEAPVAIITTHFPEYYFERISDPVARSLKSHSPPLYPGLSACILNCVFRI